jgi:transcriptional regulator with XRE-family HTH domain
MYSSAELLLAAADLSEFGQRLRATRRARGMTQDAIAGGEISAAYVSRIEAGQRRPDMAVARLLAERLDTTVEYLLTGVEPKQAEEIRLSVRYAELALKSGEAADAHTQLHKLYETRGQLGPMLGDVMWLLALSLETLGRSEEAIDLLEQLATDPSGISELQIAIALGRCYRETGDLAHSIEVGERARAAAVDAGLTGTDDEIRLALSLVASYHERGDQAYASQLCQRALAAAEARASSPARAAAYWNASILASKRARHGDALTLAERAIALMSDGEDDRNVARLRSLLGLLLLSQDEPDPAAARIHLLRAQQELMNRDGSTVDLARCEIALAHCLVLEGDFDEATSRATAALGTLRGVAPFMAAEAEVVIGRAAAGRGDTNAARDHYRSAVGLLTAAQSDREAGQLWYQLGELLEAAGDDAGSRDAFRSAAASTGLRGLSTRVASGASVRA